MGWQLQLKETLFLLEWHYFTQQDPQWLSFCKSTRAGFPSDPAEHMDFQRKMTSFSNRITLTGNIRWKAELKAVTQRSVRQLVEREQITNEEAQKSKQRQINEKAQAQVEIRQSVQVKRTWGWHSQFSTKPWLCQPGGLLCLTCKKPHTWDETAQRSWLKSLWKALLTSK